LINEEVLHAFVDGETDAQTNAMILAYLSASPADAARVETWRCQNELIRASFAKIEHEPIPLSLSLTQTRGLRVDSPVQFLPAASNPPIHQEDAPPAKTGDLMKLCVAIGIAFAVGMIAALITPHLTGPLAELVANRGAKTAADMSLPSRTLDIAAFHENNPSSSLPSTGLPSPGLVRDLTALDLSVTGYQTSTSPDDPALCFFLARGARESLTLCREPLSGKAASVESPAFQVNEAHGLRAVYWMEKTSRLALAGLLSEAEILDLSRRIHARIKTSDERPD
jgi:anti-sigma factor RsiW